MRIWIPWQAKIKNGWGGWETPLASMATDGTGYGRSVLLRMAVALLCIRHLSHFHFR